MTGTVRALAWLGLRLFTWPLSALARTWSLLVTLASILSIAFWVESSLNILSTCGPRAERQCPCCQPALWGSVGGGTLSTVSAWENEDCAAAAPPEDLATAESTRTSRNPTISM